MPGWLGQSFFYTGQSTAPVAELAQAVFETPKLHSCSLICGELYGASDPRQPYLLICATPEQDQRSYDFWNDLAPQLGWYTHKTFHQFAQYENSLYPDMNKAEQSLSTIVEDTQTRYERLRHGDKDFDTLSAFHEQIGRLEQSIQSYDKQLTEVKDVLHTLKINVKNYRDEIESSELIIPTNQGSLFQRQHYHLEQSPNQVEADLGYWQPKLEQARRAWEIFHAVAMRFPLADRDPNRLAEAIQDHLQTDQSLFEQFEVELTIMFDDIKDSTPYVEQHGDHQWQQLVQRHDTLLRPIINQHQGKVIKNLGDGSLIVFTKAANAVQAAMAIQHRLQQENKSAAPLDQLLIRIGLHTGSVLLSRADVLGLNVSLAARICGEADAGQIIISQVTYQQAGNLSTNFETIGERKLKGIEKPVTLYRK